MENYRQGGEVYHDCCKFRLFISLRQAFVSLNTVLVKSMFYCVS
ncbi:hypothetical protein CoNPh10_CDS0051 [Staphylococcus phage S-CoN_Ph10]|nr:hypothetical protein CoNPh10_CDS0051 [Staphylococcus phage S-CoN_Ph10]